MAVAHAFGFARDLNLNCPTETSTFVHHQPLSCLLALKKPNLGVLLYPQPARVVAGICPTNSTTAFDALADFATALSDRAADRHKGIKPRSTESPSVIRASKPSSTRRRQP
jgi:hypothetical protein